MGSAESSNDTCPCGCQRGVAPTLIHEMQVREMREKISAIARRAVQWHGTMREAGSDAPEMMSRSLADIADGLMDLADGEKCELKANVLSMTTACLLELSRMDGIGNNQG